MKLLRRKDLWLVLALLVFCGACFLPRLASGTGAVTARVMEDGAVVQTIRLDQVDEAFAFSLKGARIQVEPGRIRYQSAACPDQVCVRCGWLSRGGDLAVCLPEKTMITLSSTREDDPVMTY